MNILTLNAGSATLKYKLFEMPAETVLSAGALDHPAGGIAMAAEKAVKTCRELGIDAIGHRIVHGGSEFAAPTRVTPAMLYSLRSIADLDPLHNPTETSMIEAGRELLPDIPAVAVFDTTFHQTIPEVAWRYALPRELADRHWLRRFGFHGLSHQYVSAQLLRCMGREPQGSKLIVCHLGNGASVCALMDGKSVDTSMGMTPVEGLVMGTRSGDIDPGLMLYLLRSSKMTPSEVDHLINDQAGLLGVSGVSSDVHELQNAATAGDAHAEFALDLFAYRVSKYVGAYAAVLNGVDAIAFTGGIGEHSASIRSRVCSRLGFLGIRIGSEVNENLPTKQSVKISTDDAAVQTWVIPTDEERQMAREIYALLTA